MKIGIIGGGAAGLLSAWLLENDYEVTLFEQSDRLGGHAHTVSIAVNDQLISVEAGFEFFSRSLFPHFNRLLELLNVAIRPYSLSYCFQNIEKNSVITLPPLQPQKVAWKSFLPSSLMTLAQLGYLLNKGADIVAEQDTSVTVEEFANCSKVSCNFKEQFFYPLYAGAWGFSVEDTKNFAAYDILKWSLMNKSSSLGPTNWYDMANGMVSYIDALSRDLKKATIKTATKIMSLVATPTGYLIIQEDGHSIEVDHLIMATDAYCARNLLREIPHAEKLCTILEGIDYIHTTIAIHSDISYMPQNPNDWSTVNVRFDGKHSSMTSYKPWKSSTPIFRSWISQHLRPPQNIYRIEEYYHAKVNPSYFQTQRGIRPYQGKYNLWLAGIYTHDIDSHESALVSAIIIAKKLAPSAQRLRELLQIY